MKIVITKQEEVEAVTVKVKAAVRYWDDATVNGVEDSNGDLIPCREGNMWCPEIEIDTGKIINWKQGVAADVHYKVCDAGCYYVRDAKGDMILAIIDDYVPNRLIPGKYGDYIIMKINAEGIIENWPRYPSLEDFPA